MEFSLIKHRLFVNKPQRKKTKNGKEYFLFYTSLGKNKGTITCKCWRMNYDLTKINQLNKAVLDLVSWTDMNGNIKYELIVKDFEEPHMRDYLIEDNIPVRPEVKPMENLGEKILEEPQMVNINEEIPPMEEIQEINIGELK